MELNQEQLHEKLDNIDIDDLINEDTTKDKYLTFFIDNEKYGIDICYVLEIISVPAISWIPHTPDSLKGIINLRGSIIPVIDVRIRFKKEEVEYNEFTCIIVIQYEDYTVGLIVDDVDEVLLIPENK